MKQRKGISINEACSIYSAELCAIDKTIEMAVKERWNTDLLITDSQILSNTDNQSACKDIDSSNVNIRTHEWVIEIKEKIKEYEKNKGEINGIDRKIVVRWIPEHTGIIGNKKADGIAEEATKKNPGEENDKVFRLERSLQKGNEEQNEEQE